MFEAGRAGNDACADQLRARFKRAAGLFMSVFEASPSSCNRDDYHNARKHLQHCETLPGTAKQMIAPLPNEDPQEFLERVVESLGEHFDCVQVFAQICSLDATDVFSGGRGNILARQKQIENWLECGGGQTIFEEDAADE